MRKIISIALGLFILVWLFITYVLGSTFDSTIKNYNANQDEYRSFIGEPYVMKGDTLLIVDYSTIKETFTLDNGVEVNKYLIINANK